MSLKLNIDSFLRATTTELSYREIETYALSLIELDLKKSKKKLQKYVKEETFFSDGRKGIAEFDAVAYDGVAGLTGPTIIEFRRSTSKMSVEIVNRTKQFYPKYQSLLMIFGMRLSELEKESFESYVNRNSSDFPVKIWDLADLEKLAKKYSDESIRLFENLGKEILKATVESASNVKDWKEERDSHVNSLNQSFKNDEVVFFLGAGVSKDAGLPAWDDLLRTLNVSIIESKVPFKLSSPQKEEILTLLTNLQSGTPLVTASYIRKALDKQFIEEIRKALYQSVKPLNSQKLLSTIATAARPIIGKIGIRAIITYNFDDLLEQHLESKNIDCKSIYREGDFEIATKRPIYHVHGFVPSKPNKYAELDKALLVFAEDGYHSLQNDPYSWSNLVQLKALRENTCVLIGLSGIDPNLRRLFSNFSKRFDGCKHYILLQRQLKDTNATLTKAQFDQFSNLHHKIQEDVFKELGLKVIWYEGHEEIPEIVKRITEL